MQNNILIVEDDSLLNKTLSYNLKSDGYQVVSVYSFEEAKKELKHSFFNIAILDINLPDGTGWDLCRFIKKKYSNTYVIFLTANDKESDMIQGYEIGGFDYITKPFSIAVLSKKIAAILSTRNRPSQKHDIFNDGFLNIDFTKQAALIDGESLVFTPKEYRTLYLFVQNDKILLTKRQLLEKLWDYEENFVDEHTLTTMISRIRKKIEINQHKYIRTVYGIGYQWIGGSIL